MKTTIQKPHMHLLAMGSASGWILEKLIQKPLPDMKYYAVSFHPYTLAAVPKEVRCYLPEHKEAAASQIQAICAPIQKDDIVIFIMMEEAPPSSYMELLKEGKKHAAFTIIFSVHLISTCRNMANMMAVADSCIQFSLPSFLHYPGMNGIDIRQEYIQQIMCEGITALHDLIYTPNFINVDYADVRSILKHQTYACIGMGHGKGVHKIERAIQQAIPAIQTKQRKYAIVHLRMDEAMSLQEVDMVMRVFHERFGKQMDVILGIAIDHTFNDELQITILAA